MRSEVSSAALPPSCTATNEVHFPATWNFSPKRTASRSSSSSNRLGYLSLIATPGPSKSVESVAGVVAVLNHPLPASRSCIAFRSQLMDRRHRCVAAALEVVDRNPEFQRPLRAS